MKNGGAGPHPEEGLPGRSPALLVTEVGDRMPRELAEWWDGSQEDFAEEATGNPKRGPMELKGTC